MRWRRRGGGIGSPAAPPPSLSERLRLAAPSVSDVLVEGLRPACRLAVKPVEDVTVDIGASKFGGLPDLPTEVSWPTWVTREGETRPLQFFAQIDLAAANQAAPASLGLPDAGLLSFFADFDDAGNGIMGLYPWEQDGSTVVYSPPGEQLRRAAGPVPAMRAALFQPIGIWTWSLTDARSSEVPDDEFDRLDALEIQIEAELGSQASAGYIVSGRHQLGGHANYIQHPVEEEVVQALAGCFESRPFDREAWERAKPQVPDWRLVLQVDSDRALALMWGDVGTLYWAARSADIDSARWGAGMFNFQCS